MIEMCANVSDDVSAEGRWLTPDPLGGDITNPQSLNRYAYALNNPATLTDPLGLTSTFCAPGVICTVVTASPPTGGSGGGILDFGAEPPLIFAPTMHPGPAGFCGPMQGCWWTKPAPKPQSPTWWLQTKVFASALGNNFVNEFKQGGCVNAFGKATANALNPFSPSLSSAGEGTAAVLAASKYNAAVQYAASATNYLGGTGLIYPMKSSTVRSMLADANATAAEAPLFAVDGALLQGVIAEGISMANGECH